ncbi:sensor histidine kinase [Paraclostridium sp. AKS73]|uniref:sensor histidine kinase n=1 Tax=Paraclostridium sp. AKS73 TaxID=2876116 RepID=UPI0021DFD0A5|nr:HAMP domain-containing sensor histidine kinase [Paraclostridium sp. AKS73]
MHYFKTIYSDIKDMTEYVYNSSEGKKFEMKNKNQEGQIGLLKTELLKMTNILKEKVELLSKEKIFLNDTISDISHQLKTPMTSLIILNDLMYDDLPEESKIEFLEKIKSQLNRMEWLIKSMLKLSKVEAKVINFKSEKVNVKKLIKMSIQPSLIPIELKNIDVSINGDSEAMFLGDMNWSIEALVNIIKNCVEHTFSSGSLDISYEENSLYTEIVIKDSGEGIYKKDLPHIFKRFYKGKVVQKKIA